MNEKELSNAEPWAAVLLATRALTAPRDDEVFTLSELSENEIRYGVQALILSKFFENELLSGVVINLAVLKRGRDRRGEGAVIKLLRHASARVSQSVQMSRFKRLMTNRDEDFTDYDKD